MMNEDSFPRSVNIKAKLEFPTALKDDAKTIDNLHKWNEYLDEAKKRLKVLDLSQSDWTCEFLHQQYGFFMEKLSPLLKALARTIANSKELRVPLSLTRRTMPLASTATTVDCWRATRSSTTFG
jgi:hypothetical protein